MSKEYNEGYHAYSDNKYKSNPYLRNTQEFFDWEDGWNDACKSIEIEEDAPTEKWWHR